MIRYALTCTAGHDFESWFASAAAYEQLAGARQVSCPVCGSSQVQKALMAPRVVSREDRPDLVRPTSPLEAAMAQMRRHVEENSDYVGMNFVTEARRMHAGEAPERAIHGEASRAEAKALIDEGVPVAPLPFLPPRKAN